MMIYQGSAKYPVEEVMLHCAAISTGYFHGQTAFQVFSKINEWHLTGERGRPPFKNGFGYHGLFMPDGEFFAGRPLTMIGAGCVGKNRGVLHMLMIESVNITAISDPLAWFQREQIDAVKLYIRSLPGIKKVSGHNDYAAKLCPGFKVQSSDWL